MAHDGDFIEEVQTMTGILGIDGVLFGEGFDSEVLFVCLSLDLVDCCESSFSELFNRFVGLMKT